MRALDVAPIARQRAECGLLVSHCFALDGLRLPAGRQAPSRVQAGWLPLHSFVPRPICPLHANRGPGTGQKSHRGACAHLLAKTHVSAWRSGSPGPRANLFGPLAALARHPGFRRAVA